MTVSITNVRSDNSVLYRGIDGVFVTAMVLDIQQEFDPNGIHQLLLEAQIRETGTDDWRSSAALGPATGRVRFNDVEVGTEYDFRVRHIYSNETIGLWTDSWQQYNEDGTTGALVTSHMIQGNLQLPPDPTALSFSTTVAGNLLVSTDAPYYPQDLFGFELRVGDVGETDWDLMTPVAISLQRPFETSAIPSGDYTFAVKLLNYASDPHEDLLAVPPTPKLANYSENAFFADYTMVDSRPLVVMMDGVTAPTTISGTVATLTNWTTSGQSENATTLGLTNDPVAGTITFPVASDGPWFSRIEIQVNFDLTVAGSPANDTSVAIFVRGSTLGDVFTSSNYIVDKNKQTTLSITGFCNLFIPSGEVISLGVGTDGTSGSVGYDNSSFKLEVVPFYS